MSRIQRENSTEERLAKVGGVTRAVAHELGNMVALILAWSGKIRTQLERGDDAAKLDQSAAKLEVAAQRMMKLVNGLALCARGVEPGEPRSFGLAETLDMVLELVQPRLRMAEVNLERTGSASGVSLHGEPGKFAQDLIYALFAGIDALGPNQSPEHRILRLDLQRDGNFFRVKTGSISLELPVEI